MKECEHLFSLLYIMVREWQIETEMTVLLVFAVWGFHYTRCDVLKYRLGWGGSGLFQLE
jgi:hypothetical protein